MKGLLIKDFKLMLMQKSFFIIIIVVACLISISSQDPTFMIGFITLILSLFTVSTISYDEFDNGYPFLLTLPFSRKTYVLEKYVYGLILGTGAWIVSVMICSLMLIVQGKPVTSDMLIGAFVILPMFLVIESLMIPVHLRFGGEKGRYALIACVGVLVVIGFVVMKIVEIFHINVLPLILAIDALGPVMFMVILLMIGFLVMLVSLKVSLSIMNKKEF
ncbi:ABC-2 transporter permease [Clostridium sp. AUH-JLR23]|uniref:ABC-2 transporter permease n=1 Tax=Clostridium sp. AUH-JLR23 TaxID=1505062 RepID=UPI0035653023